MGVLGGVGYTPKFLRQQITEIKEYLNDKNAPFGIDLLLPQVGGSARKTNKDYTGGKLNELIDIIIEEKVRGPVSPRGADRRTDLVPAGQAALFVCAVGVPPKEVVDRLHKAGIPVMNMVGEFDPLASAEDFASILRRESIADPSHSQVPPSTVLKPSRSESTSSAAKVRPSSLRAPFSLTKPSPFEQAEKAEDTPVTPPPPSSSPLASTLSRARSRP